MEGIQAILAKITEEESESEEEEEETEEEEADTQVQEMIENLKNIITKAQKGQYKKGGLIEALQAMISNNKEEKGQRRGRSNERAPAGRMGTDRCRSRGILEKPKGRERAKIPERTVSWKERLEGEGPKGQGTGTRETPGEQFLWEHAEGR